MHAQMWANNSISLQRKKYIHLQNFKLALSTNEYASWPLALLQHYFVDRFFFPPFLLMHILSGTRGIQFPCNSVQDVHTGTQNRLYKQQNSSLSFCRTGCVSSAYCHPVWCHPAHLPICHLTCVFLFLPSVITKSLIQSYHLTLTILGFKTALISVGLQYIQTVVVVMLLSYVY